jgi:hypothetical protein
LSAPTLERPDRYDPAMTDDAGMIEYDQWRWHIEGSFPEDRPAEQGYVHIGLFLTWLTNRDLLDSGWLERSGVERAAAALKARQESCSALRDMTGGSLTSEMLTAEGRAFANAYYLPEYGYSRDYRRVFGRLADTYAVEDGWDSYDRLAPVLDRRYQEWQAAGRPPLIPMQTLLPGWLGFLRPKG